MHPFIGVRVTPEIKRDALCLARSGISWTPGAVFCECICVDYE